MDPQPPAAVTACYRHPERLTRLACSECGRPICPECSRDAVVGQKCPECTTPRQLTRVIPARTLRHVNRNTPVTWGLIALNILIFAASELFPSFGDEVFRRAAQHPILVDRGEWWRLLSAMFLHGSVLHVLFNMYALWLFGPVLERRFGHIPFAAFYLASGATGGALYQVIGPDNAWAVGASGAIFGLFGALLIASYRQRHTRAGAATFSQLLLLLGINLALPLFVPNIAWQAHVGGLIAGALIGAIWDRLPRTKGSAWKRTAVALLVGVAALLVAVLV